MSKSTKVLGVVISALVLFLLIVSVPAKALVLNLDVKNSDVEKGQLVILDASVNIGANEDIPSKLVLQLTGESNKTCEFTVDGIVLSGCNGITITESNTYSNISGYGYGYGYGYRLSELNYRIIIDTKGYNEGNYNTKLNVYTKNNIVSQTGKVITVSSGSSDETYDGSVQSVGKSCTSAFTCTEWSDCTNGRQVRTCQINPNCYFDHVPSQERVCVEASETSVLKLSSPYSQLMVGSPREIEEDNTVNSSLDNQKTMIMLLFVLIILIVALLILILIIVLTKRINKRKRIVRRNRRLKKIMYKPAQ